MPRENATAAITTRVAAATLGHGSCRDIFDGDIRTDHRGEHHRQRRNNSDSILHLITLIFGLLDSYGFTFRTFQVDLKINHPSNAEDFVVALTSSAGTCCDLSVDVVELHSGIGIPVPVDAKRV